MNMASIFRGAKFAAVIAAALAMATAAFLVLLPLPNCEIPDASPQKIG